MYIQSTHSDKWESYSEQELWDAFTDGNRKALSMLFLRFYKRLFRYGILFSQNEEIVKDGIQILFLRLWKRKEMLDCPHSIEGYLYVSLRRILLRSNRRETTRRDRNMVFSDMNAGPMLSVEELIILQEEQNEREELFRNALRGLTPRQREALLLRIDSGMSNHEIARIMDLSDKRVRNLIYEATKRLREAVCGLAD